MAIQRTVVMMTNTSGQYTVTGDKYRADSWWGYTDGLHTIQVKYSNLDGSFGVDGTLSLSPSENDWFPIPLSDSADTILFDVESGTKAYTFTGNYTYLRAKLIRPEVVTLPTQMEIEAMGSIDKVILAM